MWVPDSDRPVFANQWTARRNNAAAIRAKTNGVNQFVFVFEFKLFFPFQIPDANRSVCTCGYDLLVIWTETNTIDDIFMAFQGDDQSTTFPVPNPDGFIFAGLSE